MRNTWNFESALDCRIYSKKNPGPCWEEKRGKNQTYIILSKMFYYKNGIRLMTEINNCAWRARPLTVMNKLWQSEIFLWSIFILLHTISRDSIKANQSYRTKCTKYIYNNEQSPVTMEWHKKNLQNRKASYHYHGF